MHKPDFRPSVRRLRSPAIGLVILTLLCQRLLDALPVTDSAAWMINDALRAVSFAALAWLAYLLTPFDWLRGKWLMAATLGYSVADVAVCIAWYTLRAGGHKTAIVAQAVGALAGLLWLSCRPGHLPAKTVSAAHLDPQRVYCLRGQPDGAQSLLVSLLGVFGPAGGYALAVAGSVYQFRHGRLVRQPLGEQHKHMRAIPGRMAVPADLAALDALVGTRWRLIGANCLTLLARRWREDYRVR